MLCDLKVDSRPLCNSRQWKSRSPYQAWEQTVHLHLPGSQNPALKQRPQCRRATGDDNPSTDQINWQDMSRPLYSGCEQDTVACECTWKVIWYHGLCTLSLQRSRMDGPPLLQDCSVWWQQRHQLWLQGESTTNKLWGMTEDLRHAMQAVDHCLGQAASKLTG